MSSDPKSKRLTLTAGVVRDALRGKAKIVAPKFDENRQLGKVSTDSRSITAGDLFVALRGESFDGHDYIAEAVKKGAAAVLCEKYPADTIQDGIDIFLVEDALASFRLLASQWRELVDPTVIAVAGSVGKTTTKDLLAAILSKKSKNLVWTKGSQNGFIGLAMTLMEIKPETELAVIEVGIDAPGAMIQHIDMVRPEVSLVTAISEEHLEWLLNLETIAREENLILEETSRAGGTSIINLDDPWIAPLMQSIKETGKIGFTLGGISGPQVVSGKITGNVLEVEGLGRKKFSVDCPLPGEHNARNLLGAIATALVVGVSPGEITEGLLSFVASGGRSQLENLKSGVQVLCDFYNANPASMRAAFKVASEGRHKSGTIWLCLADMKELGEAEEALHRALAADIASVPGDVRLMLYGERMKWLSAELATVAPRVKINHFLSQDLMAAGVKAGLKPEDFIVIKGSRSMRMEKVWESLKS